MYYIYYFNLVNRTSQQMEKCYENSEPENRMGKSYIFLSGLVSDFGKAKFSLERRDSPCAF